MKKILVVLGLLIAIGTGIGYAMLSSSANSDIPADRYGEFEVYDADDLGLMGYISEYDYFQEEFKTMFLMRAFMMDSEDQLYQFDLATSYVEKYINLQERIYEFHMKNKVPSEFETLHISLIKQLGIADLLTEEYDDAIKSGDFTKVKELSKKSEEYKEEGLASTDRIEYFDEANGYILKD